MGRARVSKKRGIRWLSESVDFYRCLLGAGDFRIAAFGGSSSADSGCGTLYYVDNGGSLSITGK